MLNRSLKQKGHRSTVKFWSWTVRLSSAAILLAFAASLTQVNASSTFGVTLESIFGAVTKNTTAAAGEQTGFAGRLLTGTLNHTVVPCNEVDLSWTNTNSSNTYGDLYRSEGATFDPVSAVAIAHFEGNDKMLRSGTVLFRDTDGLVVGQTYSYRIKVVKVTGGNSTAEILDNNGVSLPTTDCLTTTVTTASADPTAVSLGSNEEIALSAHVTKGSGTSTAPITGTVTLTVKNSAGVTIFQTVPALDLDENQNVTAMMSASMISGSAGTYTLFAEYSGEANYTASQGTNTTGVGLADPEMTLSTSGASVYGEPVTLTATIASNVGPSPTGIARFYAGGTCSSPGTQIGGNRTVDGSGNASVETTNLSAATYTIIACYLGDSNYNGSHASVLQIVSKATPTASLEVANSPVAYDGTSHSASVMLTSSVPGTAVNVSTGGAAGQTAAGIYEVTADFVPADTVNYNTLTGISAGSFEVATGTISGHVSYALQPNRSVSGVVIDASGSMPVIGASDEAGDYLITNFGAGEYTVTASKQAQDCQTINGIFANDASLIARHVVGMTTLDATQLKAAKVSGPATEGVSSFDAALVAQKVVGICSTINRSGQWDFTPASVEHPDGLIGSSLVENYSAILMGDVSGDWNPEGVQRATINVAPSKDAVIASIGDHTAATGGTVNVPFTISNLGGRSVDSYQFEINYDPSVLSPRTASPLGTLSEGLFVVTNVPAAGTLRVAVYGINPVNGDGVYLNLGFEVTGRSGTSSPLAISSFGINDGTDEVSASSGRVTVNVSADTSLNGRLITPMGRPVAGAEVTLAGTGRGKVRTAVTDSQGRFEFGSVSMGETYTVGARSVRSTFTPLTISIVQSETTLEMIADQ